ncbi:MAG: thioredoxin family protein [Acidobacteriota bacterium]|nr:thioredoxin family protein [Acidobacteriota bacterium]
MKKIYAPMILLAAVLALCAVAAAKRAADNGAPSPAAIGTVVEDFKLPDTDGREHTLSSLKGKNGTVLIFISVQCPVSNAYNERMEKLYEDYRDRGVSVVGINANSTEPAEVVKAHAKEKGLNFPVLKDPANKIADRLGAGHTPEVFFLDASGKLVYHGAIDNATNPVMVNTNHLRNAIDAVLAGKQVERADVKAFGCSIKRVGSM